MSPPQAESEKKLRIKYRRKPREGVFNTDEVCSLSVRDAHRRVPVGDAIPWGFPGEPLPDEGGPYGSLRGEDAA